MKHIIVKFLFFVRASLKTYMTLLYLLYNISISFTGQFNMQYLQYCTFTLGKILIFKVYKIRHAFL